MSESIKTAIQEAFAGCLTHEEVSMLYAELMMEIDTQMKLIHGSIDED
jgi:hypothetical protein